MDIDSTPENGDVEQNTCVIIVKSPLINFGELSNGRGDDAPALGGAYGRNIL